MIAPRALFVWIALLSAACSADNPPPPNAKAELAPPAATDWPRFLGPKGDAVSAETGLLQTWPKEGPKLLWQVATGESFAAPSIARGVLVHFHRTGDKMALDCLDAKTGRHIWRYAYDTSYSDRYGAGNGARSTPAISGDRVYTLGPSGELHCVDLTTGAGVWKRDLNTELNVPDTDLFFGVGTSPVVEGDVVMVNIGAPEGSGIVGLDRATGKTVWKATDHGPGYSTPVVADVAGARLAFFLTRTGAVCLDPKNGSVKWTAPFRARMHASVNASSPTVVGSQVFFTSSYGVGSMLLGAADGSQVWKGRDMACQFSTCVHRDGVLYGIDGRCDGSDSNLRAVDLKTGKMLWSEDSIGRGSLSYSDGRFYIRSEGRLILAELTPKGVREVSSFSPLKAPAWCAPVISDGRLYVRDNNAIHCYEIKAGR